MATAGPAPPRGDGRERERDRGRGTDGGVSAGRRTQQVDRSLALAEAALAWPVGRTTEWRPRARARRLTHPAEKRNFVLLLLLYSRRQGRGTEDAELRSADRVELLLL